MKSNLNPDEYVKSAHYRKALALPVDKIETYEALAQGEYNKNFVFTHPVTDEKLVLRINCGSQMHLNRQIEYEANALKLIEESGRTPAVIYVDESENAPGNGVLVMRYLPGVQLDYTNEIHMKAAAECLADIHSVKIDEKDTIASESNDIPVDADRLIATNAAMRAILSECEQMLDIYMGSDIPEIKDQQRMRQLLDNAWRLVPDKEISPYRCCINTELNSTNFLVDDTGNVFARLVDWEKPIYGDPAQDLAHFLAPTTTFWKTDIIFDSETVERFIQLYIKSVSGRFDTTGIRERILSMIPVTCLRGMCWCAMAWVQYREADKGLLNESTRIKLDAYLSENFITDIEKRVYEAEVPS